MKYGEATQIVITEWQQDSTRFREIRDERGDVIEVIQDNNPTPRFKVIHRAEIPKSKFTLDNAVKMIVDLNRRFHIDYIYADRGYGEYQIETLHRFGMDFPETGLAEKVKGVAFSESREVRDPFTKTVEKKPIKPFMVNQTALLLERDQILVSDNDELLWKQMIDYQVLKVTANGQPVYTSENEHALDAFMLSILGFQLEMPELSQIIHQIEVARRMTFTKFAYNDPLQAISEESVFNTINSKTKAKSVEWDEPGKPPMKKVPVGYSPKSRKSFIWGRGLDGNMPIRDSW